MLDANSVSTTNNGLISVSKDYIESSKEKLISAKLEKSSMKSGVMAPADFTIHEENIQNMSAEHNETFNASAGMHDNSLAQHERVNFVGELPNAFYSALKAYFDNRKIKIDGEMDRSMELVESDRSESLMDNGGTV